MNLYKLHAKPGSLDQHDVAHDRVPKLVWEKYRHQSDALEAREHILAKDPGVAYEYALLNGRKRFKAGEPAIAKSAKFAYAYADEIMRREGGKGRWEAGEPAIATDAEQAYKYAFLILEGPFKAGEPAIAKSAKFAYKYALNVLDLSETDSRYWGEEFSKSHK